MWWETLVEGIHPDWAQVLAHPDVNPSLMKALGLLAAELGQQEAGGPRVVPNIEHIFEAFRFFSPRHVRVVIIAQDPYHTVLTLPDGRVVPQAQGLCFSCSPELQVVQPSLRNISGAAMQEMTEQAKASGATLEQILAHCRMGGGGADPYTLHDLRFWASQGVLLLNRALTTREGTAGAHLDIWADFTKAVVAHVSGPSNPAAPIVFMLWGGKAKALRKTILGQNANHVVLEHSHPSPMSDNPLPEEKKFRNCGHFKQANLVLMRTPKPPCRDPSAFHGGIQWVETATIAATDGSCTGNGKPGAKAGYGFIVQAGPLAGLKAFGPVRPFEYEWINPSDPLHGFAPGREKVAPSNNRGEFLAICYLLLAICRTGPTAAVIIVTDSEYAINTVDTWIHTWKAKNILHTKKNMDLVLIADTLLRIARTRATVKLKHIRSHKSSPAVDATPGTPARQQQEMNYMFWSINDQADCLADRGRVGDKMHIEGGFWFPHRD